MLVLVVCLVPAVLAAAATWGIVSAWWRCGDGPTNRVDTVPPVRRHVAALCWVRARLDPDRRASAVCGIAVVSVIGGGAFGVLLAMVRARRGFTRLDAEASHFAATHATSLSTDVLRAVTQLGGTPLIIVIAVLCAAIETRRSRTWEAAAFLAVVVGGQFALAHALKQIVGRPRPDVLRLAAVSGFSFPSGHSTASAAAFAAVALLVGRGRSQRTRTMLFAAAVSSAVLVATSRVMLGVHWLSDVLGGLCLGWTWFAVTVVAFGGRRLHAGAGWTETSARVDDASGRSPGADGATG